MNSVQDVLDEMVEDEKEKTEKIKEKKNQP
jgi:hypothetical protein